MVIKFNANQTYIKLSFGIKLQRQVSSRSLPFLTSHRQHWQFASQDLAVHNINPVSVPSSLLLHSWRLPRTITYRFALYAYREPKIRIV